MLYLPGKTGFLAGLQPFHIHSALKEEALKSKVNLLTVVKNAYFYEAGNE
jgi:hypothetical protein